MTSTDKRGRPDTWLRSDARSHIAASSIARVGKDFVPSRDYAPVRDVASSETLIWGRPGLGLHRELVSCSSRSVGRGLVSPHRALSSSDRGAACAVAALEGDFSVPADPEEGNGGQSEARAWAAASPHKRSFLRRASGDSPRSTDSAFTTRGHNRRLRSRPRHRF